MSSHHIVRDKQEPALLIIDYDQFPFEVLGNLLEWSPTVICNESTFEKIASLGIKIDVVLLHRQDVIPQHLLDDQNPIDVHLASTENQVSLILNWLIDSKYIAITILTSEGVTKDLLENLMTYAEKIQLVVVDNHKRHLILNRREFQKWMPKNSTISFTPIQKNGKISISGGGIYLDEDFTKYVIVQNSVSDKISVFSSLTPYLISFPHE